MSDRVDLLLTLADDELILGWRNSEWTGIAPFLEEDVAFSSIAQNEIGHARALYELAAQGARHRRGRAGVRPVARRVPLRPARRAPPARVGAHDRTPLAVRDGGCASVSSALKRSDDPEIAGIAAKIDREEVYHRIHAEMWVDRLLASEEGRRRLDEALDELWPYALGVLDDELSPALVERVEAKLGGPMPDAEPVPRARHEAELAELLDEMTMVRRSAPAGARW